MVLYFQVCENDHSEMSLIRWGMPISDYFWYLTISKKGVNDTRGSNELIIVY